MTVCSSLIGAKDIKPGNEGLAPAYVIDSGYPVAVKQWIAKAADANPAYAGFSFSSKESSNYSWEQVGHTNTSVNANAGFFPFFSVNYSYNNDTKTDYVHVADQTTEVTFTIKALGISTFTIGPNNNWYVEDLHNNECC